MKVLVIDIGGNSVKFLITREIELRKFPSGPKLTPRQLASGVRKLSEDWKYDAVSIGYPGRVVVVKFISALELDDVVIGAET